MTKLRSARCWFPVREASDCAAMCVPSGEIRTAGRYAPGEEIVVEKDERAARRRAGLLSVEGQARLRPDSWREPDPRPCRSRTGQCRAAVVFPERDRPGEEQRPDGSE